MMWLWVVTLGATLSGLTVALRALTRLDAAVALLQASGEAVPSLPVAAATLDRATGEAAARRAALAARAPS